MSDEEDATHDYHDNNLDDQFLMDGLRSPHNAYGFIDVNFSVNKGEVETVDEDGGEISPSTEKISGSTIQTETQVLIEGPKSSSDSAVGPESHIAIEDLGNSPLEEKPEDNDRNDHLKIEEVDVDDQEDEDEPNHMEEDDEDEADEGMSSDPSMEDNQYSDEDDSSQVDEDVNPPEIQMADESDALDQSIRTSDHDTTTLSSTSIISHDEKDGEIDVEETSSNNRLAESTSDPANTTNSQDVSTTAGTPIDEPESMDEESLEDQRPQSPLPILFKSTRRRMSSDYNRLSPVPVKFATTESNETVANPPRDPISKSSAEPSTAAGENLHAIPSDRALQTPTDSKRSDHPVEEAFGTQNPIEPILESPSGLSPNLSSFAIPTDSHPSSSHFEQTLLPPAKTNLDAFVPRSDYDNLMQRFTALTSHSQDADLKVNSLTSEIHGLNEERQRLTYLVQQKDTQIRSMNIENDIETQKQKKALRNDDAKKEEIIRSLNEEIVKLTEGLVKTESEAVSERQFFNEYRISHTTQLQTNVEELSSLKQARIEEKNIWNETLRLRDAQYDQLRSEYDDLKLQFQIKASQLNGIEKQLEIESSQNIDSVLRLQQQLKDATKLCEEYKHELETDSVRNQQKADIERLQNELQLCQEDRKILTVSLTNISDEFHLANEKIEKLSNENNSLKQEVVSLKSKSNLSAIFDVSTLQALPSGGKGSHLEMVNRALITTIQKIQSEMERRIPILEGERLEHRLLILSHNKLADKLRKAGSKLTDNIGLWTSKSSEVDVFPSPEFIQRTTNFDSEHDRLNKLLENLRKERVAVAIRMKPLEFESEMGEYAPADRHPPSSENLRGEHALTGPGNNSEMLAPTLPNQVDKSWIEEKSLLETRISELTRELEARNQELREIYTQISSTVAELQVALHTKSITLTTLQAECSGLRETSDQCTKRLKDTISSKLSISKQLHEYQAKCLEYESTLNSLKSNYDMTADRCQRLEEEVNSLTCLNSQFQKKLEEYATDGNQIQSLKSRTEELILSIGGDHPTKESVEKLNAEIVSLKLEMNEIQINWRALLEQKQNEWSQKQNEWSHKQNEWIQKENDWRHVKVDLEEKMRLLTNLSTATQKEASLQSSYDELQKKLDQSIAFRNALQKKATTLMQEAQNKDARIALLEKSQARSATMTATTKVNNDNLIQSIKFLRIAISRLKSAEEDKKTLWQDHCKFRDAVQDKMNESSRIQSSLNMRLAKAMLLLKKRDENAATSAAALSTESVTAPKVNISATTEIDAYTNPSAVSTTSPIPSLATDSVNPDTLSTINAPEVSISSEHSFSPTSPMNTYASPMPSESELNVAHSKSGSSSLKRKELDSNTTIASGANSPSLDSSSLGSSSSQQSQSRKRIVRRTALPTLIGVSPLVTLASNPNATAMAYSSSTSTSATEFSLNDSMKDSDEPQADSNAIAEL